MAVLLVDCITVYCKNHMKHINIPCGQDARFSNVKAGGTLITTVLLMSKFTVHDTVPRTLVPPPKSSQAPKYLRYFNLTPRKTGSAIQATVRGSIPGQCYPCQITRRPVQRSDSCGTMNMFAHSSAVVYYKALLFCHA
jgi:hypothetical protein